jgi:ribonuclease HI
MMIHEGYKIGRYWENIAGFEDRGKCARCGITESMEHILTKCDIAGHKEVWELASELWVLKTGEELPKPTMGQIMACAATKKKDAGTSRLYRILVSESAHLVWRLRNERVIQQKDAASILEIHNRWLHAINNRLLIDCAMTNRNKYGKRAIKTAVVKQTWKGVLKDESILPKEWTRTREVGVLVGIG